VFVADDEVELFKITHQYLVQMDYSVLLTDNPAGALRAVAQFRASILCCPTSSCRAG
jgi:hypothetical protein